MDLLKSYEIDECSSQELVGRKCCPKNPSLVVTTVPW